MSNKDKAIGLMNEWGKQKIPFLFIIDYELLHPIVLRLDEININDLWYDINGFSNSKEAANIDKKIIFSKYPLAFEDYSSKFQCLKRHIDEGNTYLCNLTCETPIDINLTLKEIFIASKAKYKLLLNDKVLVFSPETFISIRNNRISSNPMKGTIDAAIANAEEEIMNNPKEIAEHYTIVDLIRNDLSMVAQKVQVEKFRYVEKIDTNNKDLLQISSLITGVLEDDYHSRIGDLLFTLLPAGSICGAPKKRTLEIIKEIEGYERGYYTGVVGIFDGENLDSGVMIRFIERKMNGLVFKSGGGITSFSDVEMEYQEMIDKVYVPIT
ncbi:MAG: aminodeoxychorismate synthase component I [Bacteroidetes bacterium CG2_30_32_10]|nr:MAG: aminodeoxychorismate synthase component I [Bacteroidetes bacterium CG2_30_32_10]